VGEMETGVSTAIDVIAPPVSTDKLKLTINATAPSGHHFQAHNQYSSNITYEGNIYVLSFKEDSLISSDDDAGRVYVNKIDETNNSTIQTELLDKNETDIYRAFEDGHHRFALSVDNSGYIHIIGDMHHGAGGSEKGGSRRFESENPLPERFHDAYGEQMYWISDNPQDISSFTFIGNDVNKHFPCNRTTYNYFVKDKYGVLYLAGRQSVRENKSHEPGTLGLCLAKYNHTTKVWQNMGGIPNNNYGLEDKGDEFFPSVVWEPHGYNGFSGDSTNQWYQPYYSNIKFDNNNRMHLTTSLNADNDHSKVTHLIYAYSDNGGLIFNKIDGTAINSLPMRITDTDSNRPTIVLAQTKDNTIADAVFPSIFWDGDLPAISYTSTETTSNKNQARYRYYNKEIDKWISKDFGIRVEDIRSDHYTLNDESIITIGWVSKIHHKINFADTGTIYKLTSTDRTSITAPYLLREVDDKLLRDRNILRGVSEINGTSRVITIELPSITVSE
jgi:hypothetical protein